MIKIYDKWYLDADANSLLLIEWDGTFLKPDKEGRINKANVHYRYYSNMQDLIAGITKHMIKEKVAISKDLEELAKAVVEIHDLVKSIGERITPEGIRKASGRRQEGVTAQSKGNSMPEDSNASTGLVDD